MMTLKTQQQNKPMQWRLKAVLLSSVVLMAACSEKPPATAEEKWAGFCTSIGFAASTIASDRQNGILEAEAREHANKITDPTIKGMLNEQVTLIYAYPKDELKAGKEKIREQFQQQARDKCINTPHDPNHMPDYKAF